MEAIRLSQPLTPAVQNELLKSLYWLDERVGRLWFEKDDPQTLYLQAASGAVPPDLRSTIETTAEQQAQVLRMIPTKIAFSSDRPVPQSHGDVYTQLIERGWIKPSVTGVHLYAGQMARLYRALDEMVRTVAAEYAAEEIFVPNLIQFDTLEKSSYINSFPHLVNLVAHLPERVSRVREFQSSCQQDGLGETLARQEHLAPSDCACTTSVCHHFYYMLEGQTISGPDKVATAMSQCYRYEGKPLNGLKRLREFSMREVMFAGTAEAVLQRRERCLRTLHDILERCELHYAVATASDPFILDEAHKKKLFQKSFDLKYEALATLPGETTQLAICSVNYHMDHFGKAFSISTESGEPAHCCCMAFGLDRWCYSIFAQHGLEIERWPRGLQRAIQRTSLNSAPELEPVA